MCRFLSCYRNKLIINLDIDLDFPKLILLWIRWLLQKELHFYEAKRGGKKSFIEVLICCFLLTGSEFFGGILFLLRVLDFFIHPKSSSVFSELINFHVSFQFSAFWLTTLLWAHKFPCFLPVLNLLPDKN